MASITKRKAKDGTVSWKARVRRQGFPTRTATFRRRTDAVDWSRMIEADMIRGRHFRSADAHRHTLAEAVERYVIRDPPGQGCSHRADAA
jgi:hypothetical protein